MSSDTVQISGTEFDIDDLEAALDEIEDASGDTDGRVAIVGSVAVAGDGYTDPDTYAANVENVEALSEAHINASDRVGIRSLSSFRSAIEDARTSTPAEALEADLAELDGVGTEESHGPDFDFAAYTMDDNDNEAAARMIEVIDTRQDERDDIEITRVEPRYSGPGGLYFAWRDAE